MDTNKALIICKFLKISKKIQNKNNKIEEQIRIYNSIFSYFSFFLISYDSYDKHSSVKG